MLSALEDKAARERQGEHRLAEPLRARATQITTQRIPPALGRGPNIDWWDKEAHKRQSPMTQPGAKALVRGKKQTQQSSEATTQHKT
jgi:hypothetical protein